MQHRPKKHCPGFLGQDGCWAGGDPLTLGAGETGGTVKPPSPRCCSRALAPAQPSWGTNESIVGGRGGAGDGCGGHGAAVTAWAPISICAAHVAANVRCAYVKYR